jgi:hypothetical protein
MSDTGSEKSAGIIDAAVSGFAAELGGRYRHREPQRTYRRKCSPEH